MLDFLHFSWIDILDVLLVAAIIYLVFRWIRGSTAINIFIAIIIVLVVRVVAEAIGMKMISELLGTLIDVGAIALIIIFQPEIRRFLSSLGRKAGTTLERQTFLQRVFPAWRDRQMDTRAVQEITEACREMSTLKQGALILIQRKNSLEDIISTGDRIDAEVGRRLIMNIFFKNSPLHDGAMVISDNRIVAARCTLPITERTDLPARYGMRHKAAIGISEQCDADVIVVSEETGGISLVRGGLITAVLFAAWVKVCAIAQVGIAKSSMLYGSFAFVPIILAWSYMSWQIILLGANMVRAFDATPDAEQKPAG